MLYMSIMVDDPPPFGRHVLWLQVCSPGSAGCVANRGGALWYWSHKHVREATV
jgi:hypothetical protein